MAVNTNILWWVIVGAIVVIAIFLGVNANVPTLINKTFDLKMDHEVNIDLLRNYLINNPKKVKTLNALIHPLVKKEIISFFDSHKKGLVAVEVPLLFESKFDRLFDVIIALDIDKDKQNELLSKRKNSIDLSKIYANNNCFDENKNKATYLVNNDKDKESLTKKINQIIKIQQSRLG